MVVTTPVHELLAHAKRCEVELRWAQAADSYRQALDNMRNPHSADLTDDRDMIKGMMETCIARSRETVSMTMTAPSEEAKHKADDLGKGMAAKRARAVHGEQSG